MDYRSIREVIPSPCPFSIYHLCESEATHNACNAKRHFMPICALKQLFRIAERTRVLRMPNCMCRRSQWVERAGYVLCKSQDQSRQVMRLVLTTSRALSTRRSANLPKDLEVASSARGGDLRGDRRSRTRWRARCGERGSAVGARRAGTNATRARGAGARSTTGARPRRASACRSVSRTLCSRSTSRRRNGARWDTPGRARSSAIARRGLRGRGRGLCLLTGRASRSRGLGGTRRGRRNHPRTTAGCRASGLLWVSSGSARQRGGRG